MVEKFSCLSNLNGIGCCCFCWWASTCVVVQSVGICPNVNRFCCECHANFAKTVEESADESLRDRLIFESLTLLRKTILSPSVNNYNNNKCRPNNTGWLPDGRLNLLVKLHEKKPPPAILSMCGIRPMGHGIKKLKVFSSSQHINQARAIKDL